MSGSSSSPTNTTATTTNATESNVAATNTQGVTVLGNKGPVNLTSVSETTDQGSVQAGTRLGQLAIAANTGLSQTLASGSYDFANHALDVISADQIGSASLVSDALSKGAQLLEDNSNQIFQIEKANTDASNNQIGNFLTTLGNIASANDTSQASQATAFNSQVFRYAAILVGIAILAFVVRKS